MHLVSCVNTKMQSRKKYPLHQHISQITICADLVDRDLIQNSIELVKNNNDKSPEYKNIEKRIGTTSCGI